ncbi:MAG: right-handed parallel beta-helix repeat-containing protein [Phycisphaerales bacterium]|nr:right-handed parallel beta-helix repeat-containing protein [Phycisphaerales bacterium]
MNPIVIAAAAALLASSTTALAQDAVQWTEAEGGNGHWYEYNETVFLWDEHKAAAESEGGMLACILDQAESDFVGNLILEEYDIDVWIGGFPSGGGFEWVSGEPFSFSNWSSTEPSGGFGIEICGRSWACEFGKWYVEGESHPNWEGNPAIYEWSADCNGDGIVDYGQILDGTFADDNGNGIPDCCDDTTCLAPIQWRTEDGGNGHWYKLVRSQRTQPEAAAECTAQGGYLIEVDSEEEVLFARTLGPDVVWIGLAQDLDHPDYFEPDGGWFWGSGAVPSYTNWRAKSNEPNNQDGIEHTACMDLNSIEWNDVKFDSTDIPAYFIEFSADCNGDGIVDYGQILDGTFADGDGDGQLDICDDYLDVPGQYPTIADAITAASNGETILIAAGTYTPGQVLDTQGKAITIRGAGSDSESPSTIIDGQNSHRVLQCVSGEGPGTVFENLVIRNGNAGGGYGGGIRILNSDATIRNCVFENNRATNYGGAIQIHNDDSVSNTLVTGCTFISNQVYWDNSAGAVSGRGGAIAVFRGGPVIEDCSFQGNWAEDEGGALHSNYGSPEINGCEFTGNQAADDGGAVFLYQVGAGGSASMSGCTFTGNTATNHGGGLNIRESNPSIDGCIFNGNTAGDEGGGLNIQATSITEITGCAFNGNEAGFGGGMHDRSGNTTCTGTSFDGNIGNGSGGGAYFQTSNPVMLDNCTLTNNIAKGNGGFGVGGGIRTLSSTDSSTTIQNCVITNNTSQNYERGAAIDWGDGSAGKGQPAIIASTICDNTPSANQIYPTIPEGDIDDSCIAESCDSDEDGILDCNDPCPNWPGTCSEDGQTIFVVAGESIQEAIDACPEGGTVQVAAGTYFGTGNSVITLPDRGITINGEGEATIIDGEGTRRGLMGNGCHGGGTIIDGLTFTNCKASGAMDAQGTGAGMYLYEVCITIRNCAFQSNVADLHGGGIRAHDGTIDLESCVFTANNSLGGSFNGGGIFYSDGAINITGCVFDSNTADYGGGVGLWICENATLTGCTFTNNTGSGALSTIAYGSDTCTVIVNDCSITGNSNLGINNSIHEAADLTLSNTQVCGNGNNQVNGGFTDNGGNCISAVCDSDADGILDCNDPCPNWPGTCSEDGQTIFVVAGESIQGAVDACPEGGTVEIAAGTYGLTEQLALVNRRVNLRGAVDESGEPTTILDGQDGTRILLADGVLDAASAFENIIFERGRDTGIGGGAAMVRNGAEVEFTNCIFRFNHAVGDGGAVSIRETPISSATFSFCRLHDNTSGDDGGAIHSLGLLVMTDCDLSTNHSTANSGNYSGGGAVRGARGMMEFRRCNFTENSTTGYDGGGAIFATAPDSFVVDDCDFIANLALGTSEGDPSGGGEAGAICIRLGGNAEVSGSTFIDNLATWSGAVYLRDGVVSTWTDCRFEGNSCTHAVGAFSISSIEPGCVTTFTNCVFTGNFSDNGDPSVLFNGAVAETLVDGCLFYENGAPGTVIANVGGTLLGITGSHFCGNVSPDVSGSFDDLGGNTFSGACSEEDCNGDGIADFLQVFDGTTPDCDGNGVPDECDLSDVFAASAPRTPDSITDFIVFDVSSMSDADGTVSLEVSALGELAGLARFMFVYLDETLLGYAFDAEGQDCVESSATFGIPAVDWNAAGADGNRQIRISGLNITPDFCTDPFTAVAVTVPLPFDDCNTNGLWDVCELADGSAADTDGDGLMDECDGCADDPEKTDPGACGCGTPDTDTDEDGTPDCNDPCPTWPYDCSKDGQTLLVTVGQSIQLAIDNCPDGGTVEIAEGTFEPTSALNPGGRAMTIRGAVDGDGNPTTILDGQNAIRLMKCESGEGLDTSIENIVFLNGWSGDEGHGGGIRLEGASPSIMNCRFENCRTPDTGGGGAIACRFGSSPTIEHCDFFNNSRSAIYCYAVDSTPTITFCEFEGNSSPINEGGAIYCSFNASVIVTDSEFRSNSAIKGGAIYPLGSTISRCNFTQNSAETGGAIHCQDGDPAIAECTFSENTATEKGGGVFCMQSSPQLNDCVFDLNDAGKWGGGMWNESGSAPTLVGCLFTNNTAVIEGGAILNVASTATLTDCDLQNNHSQYAGAIWCQDDSNLVLDGCEFTGNTADVDGGAIYIRDGDFDFNDVVFRFNFATSSNGGAMHLLNSSGTVSGCTFTGNTAMGQGQAIHSTSDVALDIYNSTICGNSPEVVAIKGGHDHSAVLLSNGEIVCWGGNTHGQCDVPADAYDPSNPVVNIFVGVWHSFALHADGSLTGWGRNDHGQATPPGDLADGSVRVVNVAPGEYHTVVVLEDGSVRAWGSNSDGQCNVPAEIAVSNPGNPVVKCASGGWHSLAILQNGEVVAWGSNSDGQITGMPTDFGPGQGQRRVVDIVSSFHVMALIEDGSIACWGRNNESQCDYPEGTGGPGARVQSIYRAARASWVVLEDNTMIGWGGSDPTHCPCDFPAEVADPNASRAFLDDGVYHGLAVLEDNRVFAWGWDDMGRLDVPHGLENPEQISGPWNDLGDNCISEICDSDNDGTLDCNDGCPNDPRKTDPGQCGCGNEDTDTDEDGIADCNDPCPNWPYDCSEDGQTFYVALGQSIQEAVASIPDGGTIEIAAGTFTPAATIDLLGKAATLRGASDVDGNPTTILDGGGSLRLMACVSGESETTIIESLVFTNGHAIGTATDGQSGFGGGGAVLIRQSGPVFTSCTFMNNVAEGDYGYGGAVLAIDSTPTFLGCLFESNTANGPFSAGGAVLNLRSEVDFTGCLFTENSSNGGGGAVNNSDTGGSYSECEFVNNTADEDGGAVTNFAVRAPDFVQCLFAGNTSAGGVAISNYNVGTVSVEWCIVRDNVCTTEGNAGAFYNLSTALFLADSTVCGNSLPQVVNNGGSVDDLGGNCILDECGEDLDGNGVPDSCDPDCNNNGIPDSLDEDCDGDGIPDECTIADGIVADCNLNGVPDECDIAGGTEEDDNANGIPDSCDLLQGDLNLDGCIDAADLGLLLALWGFTDPPVGDLNQDGTINAADLGLLLSRWDPCP